MAIDFSSVNLTIIDINTNTTPDMFINQTSVTFSKRILDDLKFPQSVQFFIDPEKRIFVIRVCKSNETKATSFSKSREEQKDTLVIRNKNLLETLFSLIPDYQKKTRYKVSGELDPETRSLFFDMTTAEVSQYRAGKEENDQ